MLSEVEMVVTSEAKPKGIRVKSHASMTCPDVTWRAELLDEGDLQQVKQQEFSMGNYVQLRNWHLVQCSRAVLFLYRNLSLCNLKSTANL